MAPELRQSLAILQMPLTELEAHLARQLLENCLLEQQEGDAEEPEVSDLEETVNSLPQADHDAAEDWMDRFSDGRDLGEPPMHNTKDTGSGQAYDPAAPQLSLQEHLLSQLRMASPNAETTRIADFLIGNIDDDGYLRSTVEIGRAHV